jgi:hypothetical protein
MSGDISVLNPETGKEFKRLDGRDGIRASLSSQRDSAPRAPK